jgi:hypothetical protein
VRLDERTCSPADRLSLPCPVCLINEEGTNRSYKIEVQKDEAGQKTLSVTFTIKNGAVETTYTVTQGEDYRETRNNGEVVESRRMPERIWRRGENTIEREAQQALADLKTAIDGNVSSYTINGGSAADATGGNFTPVFVMDILLGDMHEAATLRRAETP